VFHRASRDVLLHLRLARGAHASRAGQAGGHGLFMPAQSAAAREEEYTRWVEKYGEEQAQYLREVMAVGRRTTRTGR